jgi:hypothetical protein
MCVGYAYGDDGGGGGCFGNFERKCGGVVSGKKRDGIG